MAVAALPDDLRFDAAAAIVLSFFLFFRFDDENGKQAPLLKNVRRRLKKEQIASSLFCSLSPGILLLLSFFESLACVKNSIALHETSLIRSPKKMPPPKGSKKAVAAANVDGALAAAANAGTTAASRAPAGLPDAVRDQHTHVTSGPDLNYNVSLL